MLTKRPKPILMVLLASVIGLAMVALLFSIVPVSASVEGDSSAGPQQQPEMGVAFQTSTVSETGSFCVNDYQPGSVCTANDVRIVGIQATGVISPCTGEGTKATTQFIFDIRSQASGASPNRWDIGIFVDLDGVAKLNGNKLEGGAQLSGATANNPDGVTRVNGCYHTMLAPPLVTSPAYATVPNDRLLTTTGVVNVSDGINDLYDQPWWNGTLPNGSTDNHPDGRLDTCGDIQQATQLFKTIDTVEVVCTDNDGDGRVDLSVCTSWDNAQTTGNSGLCTDVTGAFPSTKSKCNCTFVNFPFTPTAITLSDVNASQTSRWILPVVGAVLLLAVVSIVILRRRTTVEVSS